MTRQSALLANAIVLGVLLAFGLLEANQPELYYQSVQEDQTLEWASFWSFFIAGGVFAAAAVRQRKGRRALPWFLVGLALFCLFVAMEEISWGQRVFGHRPPSYFLERNYQQEVNLHNLASSRVRKAAFRGIIAGYGLLLPLLALVPKLRRLFDRLAIVSPPAALMPSFLVMLLVHRAYPWKFTGEVVEGALGFAFLFAAVANFAELAEPGARSLASRVAGVVGLVLVLSVATAWWSQHRQSADPANIRLAEIEVEALKTDFRRFAGARGAPSITGCGLHKRLYTFVQERQSAQPLTQGRFTALAEGGLPEERAEFFIDPWNSPYWIRDRCSKSTGRRVVFVYSFGPNRQRDSNKWEILGDDIGAYVYVRPAEQ